MKTINAITSSEQLLFRLEKIMGMKNELYENYKTLAKKIGVNFWSKSLTEKVDKLIQDGRIEIERNNKRGKFKLTLKKPLTADEKRLYKMKDIEPEEESNVDPSYMENYIPTGKLAIPDMNIPSNNDDIDDIFDDLRNVTRNLVSKCQELKEENEQLKMLLNNAREREKKWMAQATLYRQQLISNK